MNKFRLAIPVWGKGISSNYNQFLGFHTIIDTKEGSQITLRIAARSYYRLYLNGKICACGPARTARHYCRIDQHTFHVVGRVHIAIEVVAYNKPEKYCNDCTLESGMLTAEITDSNGTILAATGKEGFLYTELNYRKPNVETMSHSRGILEWYKLDEKSLQWVYGSSHFQ